MLNFFKTERMKNQKDIVYLLKSIIRAFAESIQKQRRLALALSCAVVFATTYMLILPAFTLDRAKALEQGGIDVVQESAEQSVDEPVTEENGSASESSDTAATEKTDGTAKASAEASSDNNDKDSDKAAKERTGAVPLTFSGDGYTVTVLDEQNVLPAGTEVIVKEIDKDTDSKAYSKYVNDSLDALNSDDESAKKLKFAHFYDIKLVVDGEELSTPDNSVSVKIEYDKKTSRSMNVEDPESLKVIHFAENKKSGEIEPEILSSDIVEVNTDRKDRLTETTFEAGSFSVYAVVYTVDFSYNENGGEFSISGGDSISLGMLTEELGITAEKETDKVMATADFLDQVDTVEFSDPELMYVGLLSKDCTVADVMKENKLHVIYPLGLTEKEVLDINHKDYKAGEWLLISLKAFDTEETLTITLKDGTVIVINVTDAADAMMDGDKVRTINNPAGTTIDLFDYWIVSPELNGREGWGDLDQTQGASEAGDGHVNGTGNNKGINSSTDDPDHGHALKFSPAWAGTVYNGNKVGTTGNAWESVNLDGKDGLNSYTGNGDPFQGIVQNTLSDGYPVLTDNQTIGSTGESLQYLFDPSVEHAGKASYDGVNQLLYVDSDGYYTYDSRYYAASLNSDKTFDVTEQTSGDSEIRGFWPFGTQNFWSGLHLNTQFSMPANGQVLNPKQEYKDMQFEFSGDDDVWLYVDGVLIGDGGGIHNRTEIDINFATGQVTITGKKDSVHPGDDEYVLWLDDLYKAAGKYDDDAWEDIPGVAGHKRFKKGTYHTFDMFYLERGGGESNLYIHYNLISTVEFSAHKSFLGTERLHRDQFQFEMTGLDGQYKKWTGGGTPPEGAIRDKNGDYWVLSDPSARAIMPSGGTEDGEGFVDDPQKYHSDDGYTSYITGVTEDGNVNFGQAEISQSERDACHNGDPSSYLYRVREIVPDDAVNADGVRWDAADDAQKAAGGFVKDQIVYDGRVYYWLGTVEEEVVTAGDGSTHIEYVLDKSRFLDSDYSVPDTETTFFNFSNTFVPDLGKLEFTKVDGSGTGVPGAEFALYTDEDCRTPLINIDGDNQPWTAVSDDQGTVVFDSVRVGEYFMKETRAPEGYKPIDTVYKVTIVDSDDHANASTIVAIGDDAGVPVHEIYNTKISTEGLEVDKFWKGDTPDDDAAITYKLYQTSVRSKIGQYSVDVSELGYGKPDWSSGRFFTNDELTGDKTHIKKGSVIEVVITTTSGGWSFDTLNEITPITSNQTIISDTLSGNKDLERRIRIEVTDESSTAIKLYGQLESCYDGNGGKPNISVEIISEPSESEEGETKLVATATLGKNTVTAAMEPDFSGLDPAVVINRGSGDWTSVVKNLPERSVDGEWETVFRYYVEEVESSIPSGFSFESIYPGSAVPGETVSIVNKTEPSATIDIDIRKTDDKPDSENYLAGAVFELQYRADSTKSWEKANTIYGMEIEQLDENSRFTVPEEGITLTGLIDGQYRMEEKTPPSGYIILEDYPVVFTVENGEITSTDGTLTGVRYTEAGADNNALFIVPNTPGPELPQSGGIGTTIFYVLGSILVICGGIYFTARKRTIRNRSC